MNSNEKEKQVIIQEINKWRESKLLPSEYCDFLLNLYSSGSNAPKKETKKDTKSNGKSSLPRILTIIGFVIVVAIGIYFFLNFTSFHPIMQMTILGIITLACYVVTSIYYKHSNPYIPLISHSIASVLLSVFVLRFLFLYGLDQDISSVHISFLFVFVVWLIMSIALRHPIIFSFGLIGLTVLYNQVVTQQVPSESIIEPQLYWVPVALITCWLGYALYQHKKQHQYSYILLFSSFLYFFMPEINLGWLSRSFSSIQESLALKIIILFILFFIGKSVLRSQVKQTEV
ncbi:hypothetical protein BHU72_11575 [Desulfuribacillus stibiiarsenatis]|uniref:DUF2157 domain-containing protein n=1 Tax=Desulfuribacillus stibiiarsenatis TaxID=1390249 RepID=A0A1E5L7N4_9FIRM|nr:hypothetical protein [Desulfuribacillus stibiiarsenatis]OEH86172.1 hypothetical protein BHU72_11575 [Desulfuribacillus stibiiarsenatis]